MERHTKVRSVIFLSFSVAWESYGEVSSLEVLVGPWGVEEEEEEVEVPHPPLCWLPPPSRVREGSDSMKMAWAKEAPAPSKPSNMEEDEPRK